MKVFMRPHSATSLALHLIMCITIYMWCDKTHTITKENQQNTKVSIANCTAFCSLAFDMFNIWPAKLLCIYLLRTWFSFLRFHPLLYMQYLHLHIYTFVFNFCNSFLKHKAVHIHQWGVFNRISSELCQNSRNNESKSTKFKTKWEIFHEMKEKYRNLFFDKKS